MGVKHLNPRQGITTPFRASVPGSGQLDYCVKHLNPRQGITTLLPSTRRSARLRNGVKHLNPRQGITTGTSTPNAARSGSEGVKHLNPRQGITTNAAISDLVLYNIQFSVKHLNPRQGITTVLPTILRCVPRRTQRCETPKSPPGDYNCSSHNPPMRSPSNSTV